MRRLLLGGCGAWLLIGAPAWALPAEATLYSFQCAPDPSEPDGSLVADASGDLFTTSTIGGAKNVGSVLELQPPAGTNTSWTGTTIYSFDNGVLPKGVSDANNPTAGLVAGPGGSYFGTGYDSNDTGCGGNGCGAVFQIMPPTKSSPNWSETVLHDFTGTPDGQNPAAGLIVGHSGSVFGTTLAGGAANAGAVFKLVPPKISGKRWPESVIYSFSGGADGGNPAAPLVFDHKGNVYGTTEYGGSGNGVVFRVNVPTAAGGTFTETVLYSFTGSPDGSQPVAGLTMDPAGNLYGTTLFGGANGLGSVFRLSPPASGQTVWTETVLYSFTGGKDGALPAAALYRNGGGVLFGTTEGTGATGNNGSAFKLTPPVAGASVWTQTTLHSFAGGADGAEPLAALVPGLNKKLYGTTVLGGTKTTGNGTACGTVFYVTQ